MAKTNYTKVEEALTEGMLKMTINGLLGMASIAAGIGQPNPAANVLTNKQLLAALQFEIKYCRDHRLFNAGGFTKPELKKILDNSDNLTPEEWETLKEFKAKADIFRKEMASKSAEGNEELVEAERKKHINKRYNTKEKWLPLH